MINTNKYTKTIIQFLNKHLNSEHQTIKNICEKYDNNEIIQNFTNIFKNQENFEINMIKSVQVKKLHSYESPPLMYIILNDIYKDKYFTNLSEFYQWIREQNIDLHENKFKKYHPVLFDPSKNRLELHNLTYDSIFISNDVIHHIESEDLNYKIYSNANTEIHIYHPNSNDGPDIQLIMRIIDFYRTLLNKKTNTNIFVKLVVFYGEQKKFICSKGLPLCSDNVNSGLSMKGVVIHIWRKEEFYKVLIHELIHYFGVDFYISNLLYQQLNKHFQKVIRIKGVDRINESYTEILAIAIHSVLYAYLNNLQFSDVFSYEILFTNLQVAKILDHFNCIEYLDNTDDTYNTNQLQKEQNQIKQNTSVFSYYVVKCMFMENFDKFLDFWKMNNFILLKDKKTEQSYIELYKTIMTPVSLNKSLIKKINSLLSSEDIKLNNHFIVNTMRMSVFQF